MSSKDALCELMERLLGERLMKSNLLTLLLTKTSASRGPLAKKGLVGVCLGFGNYKPR